MGGKTKLLCTILPLLLLCGCWSRNEISELSIVMGVAVEKDEKNETGLITQIVVPENVGLGSGNGRGSGKPYVNIYTGCKHIAEGMVRAGNQSDKEIYLSHNLVILFDDDVAKEGIYPQLDYFLRNNEMRLNVLLFVTEDDVKEIMNIKSETYQIPATYIASLGVALRESSEGVSKNLLEFITDMLKKSNASLVPIVTYDDTSEPKSLRVTSSALFKDDKMVAKLSPNETRGIMWLNDTIERGVIITEIDGEAVSARINGSSTKRRVYADKDGKVSVACDIRTELFLKSDKNGIVVFDNMDRIKNKLAEEIKSEIRSSFDKMQEKGTDVYGFAHNIYQKDFRTWEKIKDDWENIFRNLQVDLNVEVILRETGSIDESVIKESEE